MRDTYSMICGAMLVFYVHIFLSATKLFLNKELMFPFLFQLGFFIYNIEEKFKMTEKRLLCACRLYMHFHSSSQKLQYFICFQTYLVYMYTTDEVISNQIP